MADYRRDADFPVNEPKEFNRELGTNPQTDDIERVAPIAFLKTWQSDGEERQRVDMTTHHDPWLERLNPTVTPLYAHPSGTRRENEVLLREWVALIEPTLTAAIEAGYPNERHADLMERTRAALTNTSAGE